MKVNMFTGWEKDKLKQLKIKTDNPFDIIRQLLLIIEDLKRKLNNG